MNLLERNKILLIFINTIVFTIILSCDNTKNIDNTNSSIPKREENQINRHLTLSKEKEINLSKRIKHADSAYKIITKYKDLSSETRKLYNELAKTFYYLNENDKSIKSSKKLLELSLKKNDSLSIATSYNQIGINLFKEAKHDSAYLYYTKAEKYLKNNINNELLARTRLHKAYILLFEKDYLNCEITTINIIKSLNNQRGKQVNKLLYECYNTLGSTLKEQENYDEALNYHKKALILLESNFTDNIHQLETSKAFTHNYIGLVLQEQKKHSKAINYFNKGLRIKNLKKNNPEIYSALLDNRAYSKMHLDNKNGFDDMISSLKIRDSLNIITGIISSNIHLSEYYLKNRDTAKALNHNKTAYEIAKISKYYEDQLTTLEIFSRIEPENNYKYSKQYIKISDSFHDLERKTRNKLARIEFETDEIIHEKEQISSQNRLLTIIVLIIIVIGFMGYVIARQKNKQKELLFAQQQQRNNEEIYRLLIDQQTKIDEVKNNEKKRIARELHDGIMNKLASTRLNLFILTKRNDQETINKCVGHINEIQNIEKEVRAIAHELTNDLDTGKSNFKSILTELFENQNSLYTSLCEYYIDKSIVLEELNAAIKMHLYRILQEALNNCNKYANSKNISISIVKDLTKLVVTVEDDGIGFNYDKTKKGIGIRNMIERSKVIKGKLTVDTKPNKGTKIILEIENFENNE